MVSPRRKIVNIWRSMAHRAKIALIGPRVSSKVAKRAVIPKLGVMMESRFDAENLPKIRLKKSMVKPCMLAAN